MLAQQTNPQQPTIHGPYRRKGSRRWFLSTYQPGTGKRKTISCDTSNFGEALLAKRKAILSIPETERSDVLLAEAVELWLSEVKPKLAPSTWRNYRSASERWVAAWGSRKMGDLTAQDLANHTASLYLTHHANSIAVDHNRMKNFFTWGARQRMSRVDFAQVPQPKRKPNIPRILDETALQGILAAARCEPDLHALIQFLVETGLRVGCAIQLREHNFDFARKMLWVEAEKMKGATDFHIPISDSAVAIAQQRLAIARPFLWPQSYNQYQLRWQAAQKRAGIAKHFVLHDLRKTFFSRMRARGVPMETAMRLCDHRDIGTALRFYRAITPDEMRKALQTTSPDAANTPTQTQPQTHPITTAASGDIYDREAALDG